MESNVNLLEEEARIPWPGPQPYDEEHWEDFFGRDPDLRELLGRVRVNKLTVLLGASGTGKTSLIRAGLVPLLRQQRYHPQGDQATWPVLLLRRWGAVGSSSLEENFHLQLDSAIDAIHDWGVRLGQDKAIVDAENLRSYLKDFRKGNSGPLDVLEVVEALAREQARRSGEGRSGVDNDSNDLKSLGGLILVFDQFEEQLRAGLQASSEALELIRNLFRSKAPTRVLISMRREYQYALRPLELVVGGLSGRSLFLEPLEEPTVVEVVKESSKSSNVPIDTAVAERIVGWLAPGVQAAIEHAAPRRDEFPERSEADLQGEKGRPDLLQLQAVLLELYYFVRERRQRSVNMHLFDEFTSQFVEHSDGVSQIPTENGALRQGIDGRERALAQRVLGGALERWIEFAIQGKAGVKSRKSPSKSKSRSHAEWADMEAEDLRLQVHRIAVRLAPKLSSGDYKVSQEENTLFRQALGEEIAKLGLKDPELRSKVRVIENEGAPPRLNWWEDLGFTELDEDVPKPSEAPPQTEAARQPILLSGLARVKDWSLMTAGDQILICFKETLHRLATANILQYTFFGSEKGLYWELVHDQFGPSFTRWAERQRGTWDDCKSSLVVCSGIQPIAVPVLEIKPPPDSKFYDLVKISWQGCGIENSKSERLKLINVRFKECYLVGTIFDAVDFVDCFFENCDLKGVLFRNCKFQATTFEQCDANIAIVGGSIADLEFRNCHLLQPAIDGTSLIGGIRYTGGTRVIQGYFDVVRKGEAGNMRIDFDKDSRAALCLAGTDSWGLLKFENQALDLRNSPLVEDYKVRS